MIFRIRNRGGKMRNNLTKYISLVLLIMFLLTFTTPALGQIQNNYQDQQWIQTVSLDKQVVDNDLTSLMIGVDPNSISLNNLDRLTINFQTYSKATMTDSLTAMNRSKLYTVSLELSPTKTAYRHGMDQAKWAGYYATQFSNDMLSNQRVKALDDFNKSNGFIMSYHNYIREMNRVYGIYLKQQNKD